MFLFKEKIILYFNSCRTILKEKHCLQTKFLFDFLFLLFLYYYFITKLSNFMIQCCVNFAFMFEACQGNISLLQQYLTFLKGLKCLLLFKKKLKLTLGCKYFIDQS